MSSNINPTNIDETYPVAGVDNDSQGFRDNFANIKTNFEHAESEIDDLQAKAVLKSALTGSVLDNDMSGSVLTSPTLRDTRESKLSLGTVATSETASIDFSVAPYQTLTTGGDINLDFASVPATGSHAKVRVEVSATAGHSMALPAAVTVGVDGLVGFESSANTIYFRETGVYIYEFSTSTGGTTIAANELTRARNDFWRTPASSIGAECDVAGMIAFDASYIYTCTATYDGSTQIWKRTSSGAVW